MQCKWMFLFGGGGGGFPNDGFRVAIFIGVCFALHIGFIVFVFDFCFVYFFSVRFCTTVPFVRSEQKEGLKIIREIINNK